MRATLAVFAFWVLAGMGTSAFGEAPATYNVKLVGLSPPKLSVDADIPIEGSALAMETTRPGGIVELDAAGWPALVSNLRVADATGRRLEATPSGPAGWTLTESQTGRVRLSYDVDYAALAAAGWPAPREAVFSDADHLVLICRSIFVTTKLLREANVAFDLPQGWRAVTPWEPRPGSATKFSVADGRDLVANLVVMSRLAPEVVTAGSFRLLVVPMGPWQTARKEVRRVLGAVVPRLVGLIGVDERERYLVVLLPIVDEGAESYRRSFALTYELPPSRANCADWGNQIAHEIFHLWNGWRLTGADYAGTQWFQEGFTEYAANLSMVSAGLIDVDQFSSLLSKHVGNYRKLTTTLEAIGTRKGPPLYSAGALVAFSWDVRIRQATGGKRGFDDFLKALWTQTDHGRKPYGWPDIEAALTATAPVDWEAYYRSCIRGTELLPLDRTFGLAGLRLDDTEPGSPRVSIDPAASAAAKALFQSLVKGR